MSKGAHCAVLSGLFGLASVLLAALVASCKTDLPSGEKADQGTLYYPMGVALAAPPEGDPKYAYVLSTNFDQCYNSGWISVVDLETRTLVEGSVKVPSLGGDLLVSDDGTLLLAGYRGDGLVTAIDVEGDGGSELSCDSPGAERFHDGTDCDARHLFDLNAKREKFKNFDDIKDVLDIDALKDPYAASYFRTPDERAWVAVTFLGSAWLALFQTRQLGEENRLVAERVVRVTAGGGLGRVVPITVTAGDGRQCEFLLAASQYTSDTSGRSRLYSIDVARLIAGEEDLVQDHSVSTDAGGTEIQDIAVSPDGTRVFVLNRSPDALLMLRVDVERCRDPDAPSDEDEEGSAIDVRVVSGLALEGRPTALAYVDRQDRSDLLAVTSLEGNAVFVVTVEEDALVLSHRFDGELADGGPIGIAHARIGVQELLLVTRFYDGVLSIFDVASRNPLQFEHLADVGKEALDRATCSR